MKRWAAKRKQELEAMGARELATVFELIVKICELDERLNCNGSEFVC